MVHLLDKVSGAEEEAFQAFFHVLIVEGLVLIEDEILEVFLGFVHQEFKIKSLCMDVADAGDFILHRGIISGLDCINTLFIY